MLGCRTQPQPLPSVFSSPGPLLEAWRPLQNQSADVGAACSPYSQCSLSLYCRVLSATVNLRGNPGPRGNVSRASVTQLCGSWRGHSVLSQGWSESSCPTHWPGQWVLSGCSGSSSPVVWCVWLVMGQGSSAWSRTCLGAPARDLVLPSARLPGAGVPTPPLCRCTSHPGGHSLEKAVWRVRRPLA